MLSGGAALAAAIPGFAIGTQTATASAGVTELAAAPSDENQVYPGMSKPTHTLDIGYKIRTDFGKKYRAILANGAHPGSTLEFTKGDTFRTLVNNRLTEPTSVHWHGLILPYLQDGVAGVSQAPIPAGEAALYEFPLRQSGTYWYHSHYMLQEQDGLGGPLIIQDPNEPLSYDKDAVLFMTDVVDGDTYGVVPSIKSRIQSGKKGAASAYVKNPFNMGTNAGEFEADIPILGCQINGESADNPWTFKARRGDRIRLRLINACASSTLMFKIRGLKLTVVATDGNPVEPITCDHLVIGTAERYDLIVTLTDSGSYEIDVAVLGDNKWASGILHTSDVTPNLAGDRPNFVGVGLSLNDLRSIHPISLGDGPVREFDLTMSRKKDEYIWYLGGRTAIEAYTSDVPGAGLQPMMVKFGERVRITYINKTPMVHPMHLHGHFVRVLNGQGDRSPLKDTVLVLPRAKLTVELFADNPGQWALHCHNLYHMAAGMFTELRYSVS